MKKTETQEPTSAVEEFISLARIARTRGLRGELVADLLTDFPERFAERTSLVALWPDGRRKQVRLEEHWFQRDRIILKFAGYDSIEAAREFVGCELVVPESERAELPANNFYDWELAGCTVETVSGKELGSVREVMRTGGVEMLVVQSDDGRERLIPMAHDICVQIDVEAKLIRVNPPEGLLEL